MWYNDKQVSVNVLSYSDILMLKKQSNSCTWQEKKNQRIKLHCRIFVTDAHP